MNYIEFEYDLYRERRQRAKLRKARHIAKRWKIAALLFALLFILAVFAPLAISKEEQLPAAETAVPVAVIPTAQPIHTVPANEEPCPLYQVESISFYPVPLDHDLQAHIIRTCQEYGINPALVLAVIQKESSYDAGAIGDGGNSAGLMQVQQRWHGERMERLGVSDLLDPYQNTLVGIDYLAELLTRWNDTHKALMAYNMGESKALSLWSSGIVTSQYSCSIVDAMEGL